MDISDNFEKLKCTFFYEILKFLSQYCPLHPKVHYIKKLYCPILQTFTPKGFKWKRNTFFNPQQTMSANFFFWIQSTSKVFRRLLITKIAYSLKYDRLLPQFQSIAIFIYFIPMITTKLQFLGICFWLIGLEKQKSSLYNQTTVYGVK